jgi:hypothetical protein
MLPQNISGFSISRFRLSVNGSGYLQGVFKAHFSEICASVSRKITKSMGFWLLAPDRTFGKSPQKEFLTFKLKCSIFVSITVNATGSTYKKSY